MQAAGRRHVVKLLSDSRSSGFVLNGSQAALTEGRYVGNSTRSPSNHGLAYIPAQPGHDASKKWLKHLWIPGSLLCAQHQVVHASSSLLLHRGLAVKRSRKAAPAPIAQAPGVELRKNKRITADPVRLVVDDEHMVVSLREALERAEAAGLDLVEVAPNADPPVCRIMDVAAKESANIKIHTEALEKKRLMAKDAAKAKEIRVGCKILQHDLNIKLKKIDELLEKGYRVTVSSTYEFRKGSWKDEYPKAIQVAKNVWQMYKDKHQTWFDYGASGNKQISIVLSHSGQSRLTDPFPWEVGSRPPPFMIKMQEEAAAAAAAGEVAGPPVPGAVRGGRGGGNRRRS